MKKLILFLTLFVALLIKPFSAKASQLVVSPSDLEYIGNGLQMLQNLGVVDNGVLPIDSDGVTDSLLSDFGKLDITTSVSSTDFTVEEMPVDVMLSIINGEYVQNDGTPIPTDYSRLDYVSFDNGYYSGHAVLYEGEIVCTVDSSENLRRVCDVKYGGSEISVNELKSLYTSFANEVKHDVYNYGVSNGTSLTYYLCFGSTSGGRPSGVSSCFITNQYIPGVIVPRVTSGTAIQSWYTNNPDLISCSAVYGNNDAKTVTPGNYTVGGYNYSYVVTFASGRGFTNVNPSGTISGFLNGDTSSVLFGKVGYAYDSALLNNDAIPFLPTDGDVISLDDSYAVDDVINFPLKGNPDTDKHYNPGLDTTADNYPVSVEQDSSVVWDPTISTPANPEPPTPEPTPTPEFDTTMVDIPFFTGLERRFPFCIPWDIKRAMQLLSVSPEPPSWDFYWNITVLEHTYSYHCVGDLSAFSGLADILRKLLFLSSFIGLAIFTYKHLF